jgi:glucose-1-phosphate adenylyltransferase
MSRPKTLALIMAGGEGGRLEVLTRLRPKPALPYAGIYRLIDFPLSNCMHSGLSDVWVIEQYEPQSLNDHLANGRPWDLDRTHGGLRVVPPHRGAGESGWDEGNADALYKNRRAIRELGPDLVLVLSADAVYKLAYRPVFEGHQEAQADVTVVTTRVPIEQASRFGTLNADERGLVTDFQYKPRSPKSDVVTTEVFVYNASKLLETLEDLR